MRQQYSGVSALVALAWVKGEATKGENYYFPDISNDNDIGKWMQIFFVLCCFFAGFCMVIINLSIISVWLSC
jgi:hypothetical protein